MHDPRDGPPLRHLQGLLQPPGAHPLRSLLLLPDDGLEGGQQGGQQQGGQQQGEEAAEAEEQCAKGLVGGPAVTIGTSCCGVCWPWVDG